MKNPIYLKAAKLVASGELQYSCNAIKLLVNLKHPFPKEKIKYEELLCPFIDDPDYDVSNARYEKFDWWNGPLTPENQLVRSIALLFAYEMGL